jgi:dolichyl-phosphate beta-glucosyltransferase
MRDLSIIIPAYNEAERIGETLDSIAEFLAERRLDDEVIVVDDGSVDDTIAVVESYKPRFRRLVVLESPRNLGKGHAVRKGMLTGTGRQRLFLDADNSTNVREFDRLMAAAAQEPIEPAVVIGSVAVDGSVVAVRQPGMRATLGRIGNRVIQRLVLPGIEDTQRGFKVFTGDASDAVFRRCTSNGWAFDVEALALARGLGYHILEVPVTWEHRDDSRVRPGAYVSALLDVARIKVRVQRKLRDTAELVSQDAPPSR